MFPFEPNEYLDQYPHIFVSDFQNIHISTSSSSSSSPLSSNNGFFNSPEIHLQPHYHHQEVINNVPEAESQDLEKRDDDDDQRLKFTLWKNEDDQSEIKWMSSKMRKMKGSDQKQQQASSSVINHRTISNASSAYDNNNHHLPIIRVCADCNTTKTPLWRSGPKGPKSLCNACGIRQRKARRAMAAAENGKRVSPAPVMASPMMKVKNKELKKRCRSSTTGVVMAESSSNNNNAEQKKKKNSLEDFLFNLSKKLAFHRVFPQEETDAAILLMALSCNGVLG